MSENTPSEPSVPPSERSVPPFDPAALTHAASDALNVRRVFGEAYERNGTWVIPVARGSVHWIETTRTNKTTASCRALLLALQTKRSNGTLVSARIVRRGTVP